MSLRSYIKPDASDVDWSKLRIASLARLPDDQILDDIFARLESWLSKQPSSPTSSSVHTMVDIVFGRDLLAVQEEDRKDCFLRLRDHISRVRSRLDVDTSLPPGSMPTRAEVTAEEISKFAPCSPNLVAKVVAPWHRREVIEREVMTFRPGAYISEKESMGFFFFHPTVKAATEETMGRSF